MMKQNFYIKFEDADNILIGDLTYEKNSDTLVGRATTLLPYTDNYWAYLQEDGEKEVKVAGGVDEVNYIFVGKTKNAYRKGTTKIVVEMKDNGVNFQRPYGGTYTNEPLKNVITDIADRCGFTAVFDNVPAYVLEQEITRSSTIETGIMQTNTADTATGNSASTISGVFHSACDQCKTKYSGISYVTTVKNKCPKCGKQYSIEYKESSDEYYCSSCGTEFCGICGFEKNTNPYFQLTLTYGPKPGTSYVQQPSYSSNGTTCEQELLSICKAYNQYVYITPDNQLVVRDFNGIPLPDYTIEKSLIQWTSLSNLKNLQTKIEGVTVEYNAGKATSDITGVTDDENMDRLTFSRPEMDKTAAQALANNILLQELKDTKTDIEVVTPMKTEYTPGKWIKIPFFDDSVAFCIVYSMHEVTSQEMNTSMRLRMYPSEVSSIDLYTYNLTEDTVINTAAGFSFSYVCHNAECLNQKKTGDTYAMSMWLFDRLTKVGDKVRVLEYEQVTGAVKEYYIQIQENGTWNDFDYEGKGFDSGFWPAEAKISLQVVKS